jgi:hypothetical protein
VDSRRLPRRAWGWPSAVRNAGTRAPAFKELTFLLSYRNRKWNLALFGTKEESEESSMAGDADAVPVDDFVDDDAYLEKTRALFSRVPQRTWADHVSADEEELQEKIARLRAARLARAVGLQTID